MRPLALVALLALVPALAVAATLTPSAIAASPSAYDGKSITVAGKVSNFQTSPTPMGQVAGYHLCDSTCIVVIDETNHFRSNGSSATITGTFHASFKGPRKTFTNAVVISR